MIIFIFTCYRSFCPGILLLRGSYSYQKREASASLFVISVILSSFQLSLHCLLPIFLHQLMGLLHCLVLLPLSLLILHHLTRSSASSCTLLLDLLSSLHELPYKFLPFHQTIS